MLGFKTSVFYFVALVAIFTSCNSGSGTPVQQESGDLYYGNLEEFWQSNPACNEYTNGAKAYVGDGHPYTCILHNNEWIWTKICERNGTVHIDGESWFEGENCSKMMYQCDDGFLSEYLGHSPSCGFDLSSSSVAKSSSSSSKIWRFLNPKISYGEVRDSRDNQIYKTVVLGNQVWMAENLNYNSEYSVCEQCEIYGRLYPFGDVDNACPSGWHSATRGEWLLLNEFWQRTGKSPLSLYEWNVEDGQMTDDFGLSILPAGGIYGYRDESYHGREDVGDRANYFAEDGAHHQIIISKTGIEEPNTFNIGAKYPIRCIRDSLVQPKFGTLIDSRDKKSYKTVFVGNQEWMAENLNLEAFIAAETKESGKLYASDVLENVCPEGWHLPDTTEWNTLLAHTIGGKTTAGKELSRKHELSGIHGLDYYGFSGEPEDLYWSSSVNAYSLYYSVANECDSYCYGYASNWGVSYQLGYDGPYSVRCVKGSGFGSWHKLSLGEFKDSRDGQIYSTVTIGSQTWMRRNLNYYDEKDMTLKGNSWSYDEWCDDADVCGNYGRYYTWTAANVSCPSGWHLPDTTEWGILLDAVDSTTWDRRILRSQTGWGYNSNGTDTYGFSALPSGYRGGLSFYDQGVEACFWSAPVRGDESYVMYLESYYNGTYLTRFPNEYGCSVRCVKD